LVGASRGIGLGLTRQYLEGTAFKVIATCRSPSESSGLVELSQQYGSERLLVMQHDVASDASCRTLQAELSEQGVHTIDVVIANAGISSRNHPSDPCLGGGGEDDMMNVFRTNVFGSLLTMQTFTPMLIHDRDSSQLSGTTVLDSSNSGTSVTTINAKLAVFISSRMGSVELADVGGSSGSVSYRVSKSALNMLAVTYANEAPVRNGGIKVLCVHPGWVQTDMGGAGGRTAPTSVAQSAEGIAQLIDVASSIQRKQQMEQAPAGTTTGMASSYLGSIPTQFANFAKKFGESRCVFVAFDGELLPW